MKNVLLLPDSFKGSLSSVQVCRIFQKGILRHFPDCAITAIPIADGGEGTVNAFLSAYGKGQRKRISVCGPYGEKTPAFWGKIDRTAIIEMAVCAGLPLVKDHPDPSRTTTYGLGQLIKAALDADCTKIIVGLGGSATNDGGCGMAAALGVRFTDAKGHTFIPVGESLHKIHGIDLSARDPRLKKVELLTMCDVTNPLYGQQGAAFVFAPQKGADARMVQRLDRHLQRLDDAVMRNLHIRAASLPGSGAAGGCGFGMQVFLGAQLKSGIDTLLEAVDIDRLLKETDYVFTGEGRFAGQCLQGKAIDGIAKRARKAGVPLIVVAGDIGNIPSTAYRHGISALFSTNREKDFSLTDTRSRQDLSISIDNIARLIKTVESRSIQ